MGHKAEVAVGTFRACVRCGEWVAEKGEKPCSTQDVTQGRVNVESRGLCVFRRVTWHESCAEFARRPSSLQVCARVFATSKGGNTVSLQRVIHLGLKSMEGPPGGLAAGDYIVLREKVEGFSELSAAGDPKHGLKEGGGRPGTPVRKDQVSQRHSR